VMKDGEIAQQGAPRDLYDAPASAFIADFMGEANVLACQVESVENGIALINIEGLKHRVVARNALAGRAELAIRPNAIQLHRTPTKGAFTGRITHAAYLGDHVEYEVATSRGNVFVIDRTADSPFDTTTEVAISLKDRGIALITAPSK